MTKKTFSIAVIAGDGIGKEVMPEGLKALTAVAQRFDLDLQFQSFPWACAEHYQQHQDMLPADWFSQLQALMPFISVRSAGPMSSPITCHYGFTA